jgi:UPF0716 protein FxsA
VRLLQLPGGFALQVDAGRAELDRLRARPGDFEPRGEPPRDCAAPDADLDVGELDAPCSGAGEKLQHGGDLRPAFEALARARPDHHDVGCRSERGLRRGPVATVQCVDERRDPFAQLSLRLLAHLVRGHLPVDVLPGGRLDGAAGEHAQQGGGEGEASVHESSGAGCEEVLKMPRVVRVSTPPHRSGSPVQICDSVLGKLLLLFTLVPVVELILLIRIGQWVGTIPTVAAIVVTGVVGAWLARREGILAWHRVRGSLAAGQMPADALLHGLLVFTGGAMLLTPGVLTDFLGLALLFPFTRSVIARRVHRRLERSVTRSTGRIEARFWTRDP